MTTSTAPGRLLDEDAVRTFERDGFVVVPDLLTDAELDRYGAAVTAAVAAPDPPRHHPARGEEPLPAVVRAVHEPVGGPCRRRAARRSTRASGRPRPSCSASTRSVSGTTRRSTSRPAAA